MVSSDDVARHAGVSRSTVSRVINNYSNVPEETRVAVQKAIEELGYVPHESARLLAGSINKTIGLYIDNRSNYYDDKVSSSSFFAPLTTEIIDFANKLEYNVLVTQYLNERSFDRFGKLFQSEAIAAGIVLGPRNNDPRLLALAERGFHLGIVDHSPELVRESQLRTIVANFDNKSGAIQAVRHLYSLGHRAIGHVTGNVEITSGAERLEGYRAGLAEVGLPYDPQLVGTGDFSEEGGASATKALFRSRQPTAIFAANDESAVGVIAALRDLGLVVGKDVSVVGFDGIDALRHMQPTMSTVTTNKRELAFRLTKALVSLIEGSGQVEREIVVGVSLVVGGSTQSR